MIAIQEQFVPEKIAEVRKWKILRLAQATVVSAIRRQPAATLDEQSSAAPPCPLFPGDDENSLFSNQQKN